TAAVMATGIYLTDKIEQERKAGRSRRDAILTAGPIRLIPVLMTAITFTAAFIPPMFAPPTGMDRFRPIATGLVGAMISSTVLSLIVVPVFYTIFDDIKEFLVSVYKAKPAVELVPAPVPVGAVAEVLEPAGVGPASHNPGFSTSSGNPRARDPQTHGRRTGPPDDPH
ncbi:MAG: efflux RND transporter permease subunit, partial [Gemmatimonadetes bacterium]|nr:efflux RND transporter permease subunit [Gemmatimonadota bacterium]